MGTNIISLFKETNPKNKILSNKSFNRTEIVVSISSTGKFQILFPKMKIFSNFKNYPPIPFSIENFGH